MRFILLIFTLTLLSGCAATYKSTPLSETASKLERGTPVLIATPANGRFEATVYANSGTMTAMAVRSAFARFASTTSVSSGCEKLECLEKSHAGGNIYFVVPEILHWEDRATEWSGRPDRIEVKLSVFDTVGQELSATIFTGKSKWATFGGDHPQDLLTEPLNQYVDTLY
jgi:uncharacterized protein YceK